MKPQNIVKKRRFALQILKQLTFPFGEHITVQSIGTHSECMAALEVHLGCREGNMGLIMFAPRAGFTTCKSTEHMLCID